MLLGLERRHHDVEGVRVAPGDGGADQVQSDTDGQDPDLPQAEGEAPGALGEADLREAVVTLPPGTSAF